MSNKQKILNWLTENHEEDSAHSALVIALDLDITEKTAKKHLKALLAENKIKHCSSGYYIEKTKNS